MTTAGTGTAAPNGLRQGDISYVVLWVPDAERARAFYGAVLGWTFEGEQCRECTPQLGLHEATDSVGAVGAVGADLSYRVDDIAAAVAAVRANGGTAADQVDRGYAQESVCHDPGGVRFWLHQFADAPTQAASQARPNGGISYVSLLVPDGAAARAFYAAVLGWSFQDGNPVGTTPMLGMWSGELSAGDPMHRKYGAVLSYTVTDIAATVAAVRAQGGQASEPERRAYALSAACSDDQGLPFYLHQY